MDNLALILGYIVMCTALGLVVFSVVALLGFLMCTAWIAFSDTFRAICNAESLIFEYRKHREEFQKWLEGEGRNNGKKH